MSNSRYVFSTSEYDGHFYAHARCQRCRAHWGISNPAPTPAEAVADLHAGMKIRRPKRHACTV